MTPYRYNLIGLGTPEWEGAPKNSRLLKLLTCGSSSRASFLNYLLSETPIDSFLNLL
jgi:hypothetical protein